MSEPATEATEPVEDMDETRISELVESNLRGIGDVRLRKHSDASLRRVLCRMTDTTLAMAENLATDALVEAILAEKKRVDKQKKGKTKTEKLRTASALWRTLAVGMHKQCAALAYVYTQDDDLPVVIAEP